MTATHLVEKAIALLALGIITWWVVAPKSYITCIRKVPWLWMSTYPMNTKPWFPRYLRLVGLFIWVMMLLGLYWYRSRLQ